MSIFCEKNGCFTLPGGVCIRVHVCERMSDEVFGNRRAGLIITDIPECLQTPFQLGAVCDASRPQSEREKMRRRGVRSNDEEGQR